MNILTNKKLTIVGAAGMIGSNMAQCALMMGLSSELCLYDPYERGLEGVANEMLQSGFDYATITYTSDISKALDGTSYLVSSGGAPRKEGMTREDLLKGNAEIASQFGKDIRTYCPNVEHVVVVFNPADITGLIVLLQSGIKPSQLSTLAALDSTRLQCAIAKHFGVPNSAVTNCRTYGGHGEQMAVFASSTKVNGMSLIDLIGTSELTDEQWAAIIQDVVQGGKRIIELRGRSSFQSPAYLSMSMLAAAMGGKEFRLPVGAYVNTSYFNHIVMAMDTIINADGVSVHPIKGTEWEFAELMKSYNHLCSLRDEVIDMGIIPPISEWGVLNNNVK